MAEKEFLSRVEANNLVLYLLVKLFNEGLDGFEISVSNGAQVWKDNVDGTQVESMARAVEMEVKDYVKQSVKALTSQTTGSENFVYQVKKKDASLQFCWKKKFGDGIKFQLGSLCLPQVNDGKTVISGMFDLAIKQMAELKGDISSLKSDNTRLSSERASALKRLEKCVAAKQEMESDLYQKFTVVLNEKKSKIRKLKEEVVKVAEERLIRSAQQVADKGTEDCDEPRARNDGSDTDDTDNSNGSEASSPKPDKKTRAKKQSKVSSGSAASLLLLPQDEEDLGPTVKRRRRREPIPRESSSTKKLVLPKVPLTKKTSSTSSSSAESPVTPRLRNKLISDKSEPDADDLMAEMEM